MTITRSAVAQHLLEYADTASGRGIKVLYKDGKKVSEEAITQIYRDVKRCAFCGKRSASMGAMAVNIPRYYARVVGGLKEGHLRLMYYGLCKGHETRARKDPDLWSDRLGARLRTTLELRIKERAELMSKGDVVKAKNRADTKTEIPRRVLFADAGYILSKLQRAAA